MRKCLLVCLVTRCSAVPLSLLNHLEVPAKDLLHKLICPLCPLHEGESKSIADASCRLACNFDTSSKENADASVGEFLVTNVGRRVCDCTQEALNTTAATSFCQSAACDNHFTMTTIFLHAVMQAAKTTVKAADFLGYVSSEGTTITASNVLSAAQESTMGCWALGVSCSSCELTNEEKRKVLCRIEEPIQTATKFCNSNSESLQSFRGVCTMFNIIAAAMKSGDTCEPSHAYWSDICGAGGACEKLKSKDYHCYKTKEEL